MENDDMNQEGVNEMKDNKCTFCNGKGYVEVYNNTVDRVIIEVDCPECSEDEDEENEYV